MAREDCINLEDQRDLFGDREFSDDQLLIAIDKRMAENALRARQKKLSALNYQRHQQNLTRLLDGVEGEKQRGKIARGYLQSVLSPQTTAKYGGHTAVELEAEAIQREVLAPLAASLEKYRLKTAARIRFQNSNKGDNDDLIRAIIDGVTDDPDATAFAKAWAEVAEKLRREFNSLGGDIGRLTDWYMPQTHDQMKVGSVTFEEWYNDIKPLLDVDKMDITEEALDALAPSIYERIRTNGLSDIEPGQIPKYAVQAVANSRRESRFLRFKDGNSWMEYQKKYGRGDSVFDTIVGHVQEMSNDIALMRVMGPNPEATYQKLRDVIRIESNDSTSTAFTDALWAEVSGKLSTAKAGQKLAHIGEVVRNVQIYSSLGSATLSAITDDAFVMLTHWFNGTTSLRSAMSTLLKLKPSTAADRKIATAMGIDADYAIRSVAAASRFSEVTGYGTTAKMADLTMRASLLNAWTNATRRQFERDFLRGLVKDATTWKSLGRKRQAAFERYGLTEADWPRIKKAINKDQGMPMLDPIRIDDVDVRRAALRMLAEESRHAVPEPNARARAAMHFGTEKGSLGGEGIRSFFQFKSFPVTIITTHMARMLSEVGQNRFGYVAGLLLGTTALGVIAVQAKRIAAGKEPVPMDKRLFAAALAQGGGLGILGDFVFSDHSRFGNGMLQILAGPTISDIDKYLLNFVFGSSQDFLSLDHDKMMDRLRRIPGAVIKDFTPGQLWYTRLLLQRYLFDAVNKSVDPKWTSRMRRNERKMYKDQGARYWWRPDGSPQPEKILPEF